MTPGLEHAIPVVIAHAWIACLPTAQNRRGAAPCDPDSRKLSHCRDRGGSTVYGVMLNDSN